MFTVKHISNSKLPPLAWCAHVGCNQSVTITHGDWVEIDFDSAVEGAWSGSYHDRDFVEAVCFTGTGIHVARDRVLFATPTHTLQALYSMRVRDGLLVANSIPFLLVLANDALDIRYRFYDYDFMSVMKGLKYYVRQVPSASGRPMHIHYHTNLQVDSDLKLVELPKTMSAPFRNFDDYYEFLQRQVTAVTQNASDCGRSWPFRALTTISTGYDSPACAVLAKNAGCNDSITFIKARDDFSERNDSGKAVAEALGLTCAEYNPADYASKKNFPEAEFIAAGTGGDDIVYLSVEKRLSRVLLYTGYHGDKVWARSSAIPTRDIVRADPSGGSLTEFRLRVGFSNLPIPFIGCTEHPAIHAISSSPTLDDWSVHNSYDRPIPRRIVETAGVPRQLFGNSKKAVALPYQRTDLKNPSLSNWFSADSLADFAEFLKMCSVYTSRWDRQRCHLMRSMYRLNCNLVQTLSRYPSVKEVCPPLITRDWVPDRYKNFRTEHMVAFHWAIGHMSSRYATALGLA